MMDERDEIDRIMAKDLRASLIQLNESDSLFLAQSLRLALRDAGYSIQLDERALLQRGADAGVKLR